METYCVKCRKKTENLNSEIKKRGIITIQSKYTKCGNKKSRFVKEQEAKGLLSNFGIKTPLSKIPLLNVLFFKSIKMNEIVINVLLAGYKFIPEMHLKQLGFTYSACGPFTKNEKKN